MRVGISIKEELKLMRVDHPPLEEIPDRALELPCNTDSALEEPNDDWYVVGYDIPLAPGERATDSGIVGREIDWSRYERFAVGDTVVFKTLNGVGDHIGNAYRDAAVGVCNDQLVYEVGSVQDIDAPFNWIVNPAYWGWPSYECYAGIISLESRGHPQEVYLVGVCDNSERKSVLPDPLGGTMKCFSGLYFRKVNFSISNR